MNQTEILDWLFESELKIEDNNKENPINHERHFIHLYDKDNARDGESNKETGKEHLSKIQSL